MKNRGSSSGTGRRTSGAWWCGLGLALSVGCGEEPKFTLPENPVQRQAEPQLAGFGPSVNSATDAEVEEAPLGNPNIKMEGVTLAAASTDDSLHGAEEQETGATVDRQTAEWAMWGGAPDRNMVCQPGLGWNKVPPHLGRAKGMGPAENCCRAGVRWLPRSGPPRSGP